MARTARNTWRRSTGDPGGRRPRSPHPVRGRARNPSCPTRREVPGCGQLREGGVHGLPRLPFLPFLPWPCAELRPRARRSFPAQCWAPLAGAEAPSARLAHSLLPTGRRPPWAERSATVASARAAQRRGRGPGTDARSGAQRVGRGRRPPRWVPAAPASREPAVWPPGCRTINLVASTDKVCKDRFRKVNAAHSYKINL